MSYNARLRHPALLPPPPRVKYEKICKRGFYTFKIDIWIFHSRLVHIDVPDRAAFSDRSENYRSRAEFSCTPMAVRRFYFYLDSRALSDQLQFVHWEYFQRSTGPCRACQLKAKWIDLFLCIKKQLKNYYFAGKTICIRVDPICATPVGQLSRWAVLFINENRIDRLIAYLFIAGGCKTNTAGEILTSYALRLSQYYS